MGHESLIAQLRDSFTLVILIGCSLLSITFAIERWLVFRKASIGNVDKFLRKVLDLVAQGSMAEAKRYCLEVDAPVSRLTHYALENSNACVEVLEELMASKRQEERLTLESNLGILGTMGNVAPFIGLFGTVVGIIKAFGNLAASGVGGASAVSKGISEALVATAAGLLVAIPAVVVFNYFTRKIKLLVTEMEVVSSRLSVLLPGAVEAAGKDPRPATPEKPRMPPKPH
ncbi:MAG: MotA/TolQ/ExbB proton channel family protein [Elusimicrobiales bacterium]